MSRSPLTAATVQARPAEQAWVMMSPVVVTVVTLIVVCLCALGVSVVFIHIGTRPDLVAAEPSHSPQPPAAAAEPGDSPLTPSAAAEPGDSPLTSSAAAEPGDSPLTSAAAAEPGDSPLTSAAAAEPSHSPITSAAAALEPGDSPLTSAATAAAVEPGDSPRTSSATAREKDEAPPCGRTRPGHRRRQKRIVGGRETGRAGQFPWVVMVLTRGRFTCGGSVLDSRHVLTAAHCFRKPGNTRAFIAAADVEIVAGKHRYTLNTTRHDAVGEQRLSVNDVIPHPRYDDTKDFAKHNDLAILVLRTQLQWTRWVSAVCLPKWRHRLPDSGTVVGWGSTKPRTRVMWSPSPPRVLKQLTMRVHTKEHCSTHGASSRFTAAMTKGQICAISAETGVSSPCNGDSGGPLFAGQGKSRGERHVQFGVLSWGFCVNRPGEPFFFTYLPHYRRWIRNTLRETSSLSTSHFQAHAHQRHFR